MVNVLIVGGGAREHALAWKIALSPKINKLYVAPGNAGTAGIATNIPLKPTDIEQLFNTAKQLNIDITIVGPEVPLSLGIVDYFEKGGLKVFGPSAIAAKIESSKVFSKYILKKYSIPCSEGQSFSEPGKAIEYIKTQNMPIVIKADGLAAGKGVIIAETHEQAIKAISDIMEMRVFGTAGEQLIIEEFLTGKEVSLLAFTDGTTVKPMVPACDYKRIFDNDMGLNTGGMGAYSPPSFFDENLISQVIEDIIEPTIRGLSSEGIQYKGVLYTGLIMNNNKPKVLEFNARFGDPEIQAIIPRLKTDLLDIANAVINENLADIEIDWNADSCVGVVMSSGGYPGKYETGYAINGLDKLDKDIIVFHAGTRINDNTEIVTDGGRVLTVTASGKTIKEAREHVYNNINKINFKDCHYRKDIALREVV
jgi:phosphoribosylamine--glycine ligase